jgi:carotenoid cleavage dioxygenase
MHTSLAHSLRALLAGNWAPVERELTLSGLRVEGLLPLSCDGVFLRNGPNPLHEPLGDGAHHLFDGHGMVHAFSLRPSAAAAEYSNRWIRTRSFCAEAEAGRRLHVSLSRPPAAEPMLRGLAAKAATPLQPDSPYWVVQSACSANNGLQWHAGRLLATYEAGSAYELQPGPELRSLGPCTFGGSWTTVDAWTENFTAHSKVCPHTAECVFIGYNLVPLSGQPTITVGVLCPAGRISHRARVVVSRPSLAHDVGITRTRTLLLDGPLVFNLQRSLAGGLPFDFMRGLPLRVGIMPRKGSADDVVWCQLPPSFAYHVANAWDCPVHPDRVELLLCAMDETRALGLAVPQGGQPPPTPFEEVGRLWRYTLDARTGAVLQARPVIADGGPPCDFPAVFPAVRGALSRYVFAAGERTGAGDEITQFDALLRYDLQTGAVVRRQLPEGAFCGDVVLVPGPDPGGDPEHGHVLLLTHVLAEQRTELLVLRSDDIAGAPEAVVHVPVRVPFGFHCTFIPRAELRGTAWA